MSGDRLQGVLDREARSEPAPAFVACPLVMQGGQGGCPWQQVYEMAYAQAKAVVQPSILERLQRDLLN